MKRVSALLAAVAMLCACAGPTVWDKPGGTEAMLQADARQCDYEASAATVNIYNDFIRADEKLTLRNKCLVAKGWTQARY